LPDRAKDQTAPVQDKSQKVLTVTTANSPDYSKIAHPFFLGLKRPSSPHDWLIAPDNFPAHPDERSPTFQVSVQRLRVARDQSVSQMKHVRETQRDADISFYVAETPLLYFKDDVSFQFISLGPTTSTVAAYSASRVGYWDLGTNRKRLKSWLEILSKQIPTELLTATNDPEHRDPQA
jgi:uncharacterized protein (DUF1499 family)